MVTEVAKERQMWINAVALVLSHSADVELIGDGENVVRDALRPVAAMSAKAEALDALAAWLDVGVVEAQLCKGVSGEWAAVLCEVACYREGTGSNLAAAIMDALRKATE